MADFGMDENGDVVNAEVDESPLDTDRFLASMARFLIEGDERDEARLLLACTLEAWQEMDDFGNDFLKLMFSGPRRAYDLLSDSRSQTYRAFDHAAGALLPAGFDFVNIVARAQNVSVSGADWRNELLAVLDGTDVDNQAIPFKATKTYRGLRFRSESEVRVAQALDRAHVMYLPNCRGRVGGRDDTRTNVEADFIVFADGAWGVLEVDGSEWHTNAAKDHRRDRPLKYHGAAVVERFDAGECFENPDGVVRQFLALLRKR